MVERRPEGAKTVALKRLWPTWMSASGSVRNVYELMFRPSIQLVFFLKLAFALASKTCVFLASGPVKVLLLPPRPSDAAWGRPIG